MKRTLCIILTAFSISLNAQVNIHSQMDSLLKAFGQDQINTGLPSLMSNELSIIYSLPTIHDYKYIKLRINNLPNDCIRFLDSLDYFMIGKDSIIFKIFSQNYAYQCCNSYKLGLNKQINNDTLWISSVHYDMKMKSVIDDYDVFMNRLFDFSISDKEIGDMKKSKRIIILKNYH